MHGFIYWKEGMLGNTAWYRGREEITMCTLQPTQQMYQTFPSLESISKR